MLAKFKEMSKKIDENDKKLNQALQSSLNTASNLRILKETLHDGPASGNITAQNSNNNSHDYHLTSQITPTERHVKFKKTSKTLTS